jgi:hypothetical protein
MTIKIINEEDEKREMTIKIINEEDQKEKEW